MQSEDEQNPAARQVDARTRGRASFRLIPAIERSPTLVRIAQTPVGRALVLAAFGGLLRLHDVWHMWHLPLALVLPTFFPAHRRKLIGMGTVAIVVLMPPDDFLQSFGQGLALGGAGRRFVLAAVSVASLALCFGYLRLLGTRAGALFATSPVAAALGLFVAAVAVVCATRHRDGLVSFLGWALVAALGHKIWYLCYSLKRRVPHTGAEALRDVCHYQPLWSPGAVTPSPKGGSHLDRLEVDTPEALAVCQLKGLKLLAWALLLSWFRAALFAAVLRARGGVPLPSYADALAASVAGAPFPQATLWSGLFVHYAHKLLDFTIAFHLAVGACRMAGFRALRGVYRPLEARTVAEFWNRVNFYFKELLVDVFFYPTYLRLRGRGRLRIFAATFAAAGAGNFLYHFLRRPDRVAALGMIGALKGMQTYALYSALLALGIAISQVRARRGRAALTPWYARWWATAQVLGFYVLVGLLDDAGIEFTVRDCARFFVELLPLRDLATIASR
jgi:hypothetical protein